MSDGECPAIGLFDELGAYEVQIMLEESLLEPPFTDDVLQKMAVRFTKSEYFLLLLLLFLLLDEVKTDAELQTRTKCA